MNPFAANLRYLLWKKHPDMPRLAYPALADFMAKACGIAPARFRLLALGYESPDGEEVSAVRDAFADIGFDLTAIDTSDLFAEQRAMEREELIGVSLAYLLSRIEHGRNAELTKKLGVNASTLTRWKHGTHRPPAQKLAVLCRELGYPDVAVLEDGFLFLDLEPGSIREKKNACKERIDMLDEKAFLELYPALAKMLR